MLDWVTWAAIALVSFAAVAGPIVLTGYHACETDEECDQGDEDMELPILYKV